MRYFLITMVVSFSLMSFQNPRYDFEKAWKEVEAFQKDGLPQSALNTVNEIYGAASREHHQPYLLKAIAYKASLMQVLEEEEYTGHISFLEGEYKKMSSPDRQITGLILYKSIQDYYFNHAYKFRERTFSEGDVPDDINLWAPENFELRLLKIATEVLEDKEALNIDIRKYSEIVSEITAEGLKVRPTLYDLIGYTLMEWVSNPINDANDFDLSFNINKPEFFSDFNEFIELEIISSDPGNYVFQVLKFYQEIMAFHHSHGNQEALLNVDLLRLDFVHGRCTLDEKNELYNTTLSTMIPHFEGYGLEKQVWYKKALLLHNIALQNTDTQGYRREAYNICMEQGDTSYYGKRLMQLAERITQPSLEGSSKEVYTTDEDPLIKIVSRNLNKVWWRVVPLPRNYQEVYGNIYEGRFHEFLKALKPFQTGSTTINADPDFFDVDTRITLEKMSFGSYALIMSPSENMEDVSRGLNFITFQVSNIAYASTGNQKIDLLVADRRSGKPLKGALVNLYNSYYDRSSRTNKRTLVTTLKTNKKGRVTYSSDARQSMLIDISYDKNDYLNLNDGYYLYVYPQQSVSRSEAVIFTDRSIYRPGQKLFFKSIILQRDENNIPSLGSGNEEVTITLKDANFQEITSVTLRSNDYASVKGEFILPSGGLTGDFTIEARNDRGLFGNKRIKVEEYRRPKFKVEMDAPEGVYTLGDSIPISGTALGYTGVPINNSRVTYRVYRSEIMRYWGMPWRGFPPSRKVLIANGVTRTAGDGTFNISFISLGDKTKTWTYTIEADVLDLSGETQSGSTTFSLGKQNLNISLAGDRVRSLENKEEIIIKTTNLSGIDVNVPLEIKIYSLKDPKEIIELEAESSYYRNLVSDPIERLKEWQVEKLLITKSFSDIDKKILSVADLESGAYKIVLSSGDISVDDYLIVNDFRKGNFPYAADIFVDEVEGPFKPGDKVKVRIGTPHKELHLYHEEKHWSGNEERGWIELCGKKTIETGVREDDFGGYYILLTYFYKNRFSTEKIKIVVPWSHKKLEFEFVTMRNVLTPGQEETWKIKVKGEGGERIAAEVLASMYDMSLDQFVSHEWNDRYYPEMALYAMLWNGKGYQATRGVHIYQGWNALSGDFKTEPLRLPRFDIFIGSIYPGMVMMRSEAIQNKSTGYRSSSEPDAEMAAEESDAQIPQDEENNKGSEVTQQPLRRDLEETVFFFPQIMTDENGNLEFTFRMKEALTTWKFMLFAHDNEFRTGYSTREVITKKDLMVFPYPPRFLRQNDAIAMTAKVTNLTDEAISLQSTIEILNARTSENVTSIFIKSNPQIMMNIDPLMSGSLSWAMQVPEDFRDPVLYRIYASSGKHTDGEEGMVPVLSNNILVTDTRAFTVKSGQKVEFVVRDSLQSKNLVNVTFDYTAHPVWTAIQALPYLNDYPHDCTEQLVNKFFANALGNHILHRIPNVKRVMDQWKSESSDAFLSNLEKNQELKSAILEETPWVGSAMNEKDQKKAVALLFDINKMMNSKKEFADKLIVAQNTSGGFSWFPGGRDNTYITQYILESLGRMRAMGIIDLSGDNLTQLQQKGITFIDEEVAFRYKKLKENINKYGGNLQDDHLSSLDIQYLFVRSYFDEIRIPSASDEAYSYFKDQVVRFWGKRTDFEKAMMGIYLFRSKNIAVTDKIIASFRERAIQNEELGMYWKRQHGYYWYQLPIESQSMIIELFTETAQDQHVVNDMKLWLLNHKRTNRWATTKGTAMAVYALLNSGEASLEWVSEIADPTIAINDVDMEFNAEAGTGYIKKSWDGEDSRQMESIHITNNNTNIGWGGVYVQYFEKLEDIRQSGDTQMNIRKYTMTEKSKDDKIILQPIEQKSLAVGDVVVVRLEITVDRDMEFVHLKDMRGSGFEPVSNLSGYRWKGGLGYYESTRDLATHFFFDQLIKGTYILEYKLRVSHEGSFQSGIATLQSMYAPEFSSHSSSQYINVNR